MLQTGKSYELNDDIVKSLKINKPTETHKSPVVPLTKPVIKTSTEISSKLTTTSTETSKIQPSKTSFASATSPILTTQSKALSTLSEVIKCQIKIELQEFAAFENEIIIFKCPKEANINGVNVYQCKSSGQFILVNSTCFDKKSEHWLAKLQIDVRNHYRS